MISQRIEPSELAAACVIIIIKQMHIEKRAGKENVFLTKVSSLNPSRLISEEAKLLIVISEKHLKLKKESKK